VYIKNSCYTMVKTNKAIKISAKISTSSKIYK
jgi:hypothetical protein